MWAWLERLRKPEPAPEPVIEARKSSASITAMIETALEKVAKEGEEESTKVQVSSRRAANASRRVVAGTGQYKAHIPKKAPDYLV